MKAKIWLIIGALVVLASVGAVSCGTDQGDGTGQKITVSGGTG